MAALVVGEELGDAHRTRQRRACGDPAPARVRLLRGIDDADGGASVVEVQPVVAAAADVAGERLDRGRARSAKAARELNEAGRVGR
jgi:hypothetical protein